MELEKWYLFMFGGGIITFILCVFLILLSKKFHLFMDKENKKHAIHKVSTPRNGGIAIYLSFLIFSFYIAHELFLIVIAFLPAFLYGLYEDIKGTTPQKLRLLVIGFSVLLSILLTDITVTNIGFVQLPYFIQIPFTIFAVVGIASAINFIDGLNGLASGVSIITLFIFGLTFLILNDIEYAFISFSFASIILGFFITNFFTGKIFLGDSGAYFLGYFLGMFSLLMINKYDLSPWYPVSVLAYPIIETLFTMWRRWYRKRNRDRGFFDSEKVHLHTLLYKRKIRKSNSFASFVILVMYFFLGLISLSIYKSELLLFFFFFAEFFFYILIYKQYFQFLKRRIGNKYTEDRRKLEFTFLFKL